MIRLHNPTDESLVLIPHCSNPANFSLELDNTKQILLPSAGLLEIPLKFTPSAIGQLHSAEISFQCPQVIRMSWCVWFKQLFLKWSFFLGRVSLLDRGIDKGFRQKWTLADF